MIRTRAIPNNPPNLSKLVPSPENVRKTNTKDGIEGLAANIKAQGLLSNLIVRATCARLSIGTAAKSKLSSVLPGGRRASIKCRWMGR